MGDIIKIHWKQRKKGDFFHMFKAGTSIGKNITEKTFIEIAEAGLSTVEIGNTEHDLNDLRRYADSSGVELYSMHLPYTPLAERSLAITDKQIQQKNMYL